MGHNQAGTQGPRPACGPTDATCRQDGRYPLRFSSGQTPTVLQRLSSHATSTGEAFLITSPTRPGLSALPSHQAACKSPQRPVLLLHYCVFVSLGNLGPGHVCPQHPQSPIQSQPQSSSPGSGGLVSSYPVGFPHPSELQSQQVTVSKLFFVFSFPLSHKTHQIKADEEAGYLEQSHPLKPGRPLASSATPRAACRARREEPVADGKPLQPRVL